MFQFYIIMFVTTCMLTYYNMSNIGDNKRDLINNNLQIDKIKQIHSKEYVIADAVYKYMTIYSAIPNNINDLKNNHVLSTSFQNNNSENEYTFSVINDNNTIRMTHTILNSQVLKQYSK